MKPLGSPLGSPLAPTLTPAQPADAKRAVAAPIRVAAVDKAPLAAGPAATEEAPRIRMLPLLLAITVMLGITAWPGALAGPAGAADHPAAMALFWAMSAGFVAGVGFRPQNPLIRLLFSPLACWLGVILAGLRIASLIT